VAIGFEIWLFAVALGSSAFGGMLGMASGVFIVPVLTVFGHVDIRTAIAASIVSVIACSCGSAAPFLKERLTNIRLALVLETATTLGALTGVVLTGLISAPVLFLLFAMILALSACQMLARREALPADFAKPIPNRWSAWRLNASYPNRDLDRDVEYQVERLPLGLTLMYGAGLVSALLGIGSGVLKIPALDTALRLPIKVSSATSNFMIGVTGAASAGAYFVRGDIRPDIAGPIVLGSALGAILGARVLMALRGDWLRWLFAAVLILLAAQMALTAFGPQPLSGGRA
jgi:hypothetical protein